MNELSLIKIGRRRDLEDSWLLGACVCVGACECAMRCVCERAMCVCVMRVVCVCGTGVRCVSAHLHVGHHPREHGHLAIVSHEKVSVHCWLAGRKR